MEICEEIMHSFGLRRACREVKTTSVKLSFHLPHVGCSYGGFVELCVLVYVCISVLVLIYVCISVLVLMYVC